MPTYGASIGSTTWNLAATRGNGAGIAETTFTSNGVTVTDLASVIGPGVNGAAGSVSFAAETDTPSLNRLVYFTEALGTSAPATCCRKSSSSRRYVGRSRVTPTS